MDDINNVYYDKNLNRFVQLRKALENGWICGNHCKYYNDAVTTNVENRLSNDYIYEHLIMVDFVDKFAEFDGIGWVIKND